MVGAEKSETVPFVDYGTHLAEAAGLSRANVGAPCMYTGFRLSSKCQARMIETAKSLTSQIQATAYIGIRYNILTW